MVVAVRVCALAIVLAGIASAGPAIAAMTVVYRDERGDTMTFYREGNRVRIGDLAGEDAGTATIVDLNTKQHLVVYDEVKAYYDYNKVMERVRPALDKVLKDIERSQRR